MKINALESEVLQKNFKLTEEMENKGYCSLCGKVNETGKVLVLDETLNGYLFFENVIPDGITKKSISVCEECFNRFQNENKETEFNISSLSFPILEEVED